MSLTASSQQFRYKWLLVLFILTIAAFSAIPNYVTNHWSWETSPKLAHIESLKALQQQGLPLPGWQILERHGVEIGGHNWSYQAMSPLLSSPATPSETAMPPSIALLLRPQTWHRDLPQVDWMDINGAQGWTEDSQRQIQFTIPPVGTEPKSAPKSAPKSVQVTARFFRGWNQERTYAVLQWYAWPSGGSPTPSHWFWVDQGSQWHNRQRTPWIAVSLLFPIEPLGDIETARSPAEALGQLIQSALITNTLSASL